MSADPILSTLSNLVSLYDGITEPETDHAMTVLLPAKIAKQLKLPETATIATQANIPNSLFVTYHSELIQQFTKLLGARGSVSTIRVQYPGHIKTSGFEKQLLQTLCPQNGLIRFLEQYSGHLLRRKMVEGNKKSNSSLKVQVETKYEMNCSMDIVQNLLTKVGNLANRNASS
jgi:hypothetical protein